MVQRKRRPLHRHPAPVHHHRERRVDQQRHRRLSASFGLTDLDIGHLQLDGKRLTRGGRTKYRIVDGTSDIPRFGIAELPGTRGPRRLPHRTGLARITLAAASGKLACNVLQRGLAELSHRLR